MVGAVESVGIINTIVSFPDPRRGIGLFAMMAPLVAAVVGVTNLASERVTPWLNDKLKQKSHGRYALPPMLSKLVLSIGSMSLGFWAYPKIYRVLAETGWWMGRQAKEEIKRAGETASMGLIAMCSRGCCASVICLTELGEIVGGLINSLTGKNTGKSGQKRKDSNI